MKKKPLRADEERQAAKEKQKKCHRDYHHRWYQTHEFDGHGHLKKKEKPKEPEHQYVWMMVSNDKYELPVAVADSVEELADIVGRKRNTIESAISRHKNGKIKKTKFVKVEIDEE